MKGIFTSILAASVVLGAGAAVKPTPQVYFSEKDVPEISMGERYDFMVYPMAEKGKKSDAKLKAAETKYQVTVKCDYDAEKFFPSFPCIMNKDYYKSGFIMNGSATIPAPAGVYTLACPFRNIESGSANPDNYYIILEDIEVSGDMEIVVSPEMAVNRLSFPMVLENGVKPMLPTMPTADYWDCEEEDWDWSNANCVEKGAYTMISSDEVGIWGVASCNEMSCGPNDPNQDHKFVIAINDVSDRWHFTRANYAKDLEGRIYYAGSSLNGTEVQEAEVNDSEFVKFDYNIVTRTPLYNTLGNNGWMYQLASYVTINGFSNMALRSSAKDWIPEIYLSAPKTNDTDIYSSNYGVQLTWNEYSNESGSSSTGIKTPLVYIDTETGKLQYNAAGGLMYGMPYLEGKNPEVVPGFAPFTSAIEDQEYPLGSSAAWSEISIEGDDWDGYLDYYEYDISMVYMGNYGEFRGGDWSVSTCYVNIEGEEEINCSLGKLNNTLEPYCEENKLQKPFSIEFINDQNIVVDNIRGFNNTIIDVVKNKGQIELPVVTMLQFRNEEGKISNIFKKGENAELLLMATTYRYIAANNYSCDPVDIKVEYAPADSEDFIELPAVEDEEYFQTPAGYFYRVDLSGIDTKSDNDWYQVRITLEESEGNSNQQTFYPAFKLIDGTGVEKIADVDTNSGTQYYNMQGMPVAQPQPGSVVIRRQNGKVSKIIATR
ncbi:MAG: hypothetical protein NC095_01225 [Muribaculum sp.]|nr:hypothetical protein [Muribaculum sp.]